MKLDEFEILPPDDTVVPPEVQAQRDQVRLAMLRTEREQHAAEGNVDLNLEAEIRFAEEGRDFSGRRPTAPRAPKPRLSLADFEIVEEPKKRPAVSMRDIEIIAPGGGAESAPEPASLTTAMSRGIGSVYQGANALGMDVSRRALDVMDRVDRGERVPEMDDPVGYQHMDAQQRQAARQQAAAALASGAKGVVHHGQTMETIPEAPAVAKLKGAQSFGEVWDAFAADPLTVIGHLGAESLPQSAPALGLAVATGGAGALLRAPAAARAAGAMGGAGAGSFATEYAGSIISALQDAGVNVGDPAALEGAMANPALVQQVREKAAAKAGVVGAFDAASLGVAGKVLAPARIAARPAGAAVNLAAQAPVQGALGAAGEALGSVAAGEEVKPGAVAAEFFGEFAGSPAEVATAVAAQGRAAKESEFAARTVEAAKDRNAAVARAGTLTEETGAQHRARLVDGEWRVVRTAPAEPAQPAETAPVPAAEALGEAPEPLEAQTDEAPAAPASEEAVAPAPVEAQGSVAVATAEAAPAPPADDSKVTPKSLQSDPEPAVQATPQAPEPAVRSGEPAGTVVTLPAESPPVEPDLDTPTVDVAAAQANPEPSRAQILANNAKLGHETVAGLPIAIENAAGSTRRDIHHDPPRWENVMVAHYGRIKRTEGGDGEEVDVYLKPGTPKDWSGPVFVIDQRKRNNHWDEHKVVIGVDTPEEARALYAAHYPAGWKVGELTTLTTPQFRAWVRDTKFTKRAAATLSPKDWKEIRLAARTPAEVQRLLSIREEVGWGEVGGRMIRAVDTGGEKPEVVGRTPWVAKSDFWPGRPEPKISEAAAREAFRKLEAGQALSTPEQRFMDYATEWLDRAEAEAAKPADGLPEAPDAPPPVVDRRKDSGKRARVADMSPEEMRQALLTSEVTGLPNRRAYDEAPKRAVQLSMDVDNLKWVNDNLGHEAGNTLLAAMGEALRAEGVDAYHFSGDEFVAQFDAEDGLYEVMWRVRERLDEAQVVVTLPDGTTTTKKGVGFSYGIGEDLETAEVGLQRDKSEREEAGTRAPRGEQPPGVHRIPARQADQAGSEAAPQRVASARAAPSEGAAASPAALELSGETEAEIRAREAREKRAADEKAKLAAAPPPEDFTLAGSDNPADQARARGQMELAPAEPAPKAPAPKSEARNEDVGENLWYNRRNFTGKALTWDQVKGLNDALKVKEVVKSKVWPRPDYEQLVADGLEPFFARLVKQVYDGIAVAPAGTSDAALERYISVVGRVRDAVFDWARDNNANVEFLKALSDRMRPRAQRGPVNLSSLVGGEKTPDMTGVLLKRLWPDEMGKPVRYDRFRSGEPLEDLRVIGGNKALKALQITMDDAMKAMKDIEKGWPVSQEAWQRQGIVIAPSSGAAISEGARYDGDKRTPLWVLRTRESWKGSSISTHNTRDAAEAAKAALKPFLLLDKSGRLLSQHDTEEQAKEAARERVKRENKGGDLRGMNIEEAQRKGPARRGADEDVTADRLMKEFGFRGVNFGREGWINQAERQAYLNHAYDALLDLAEIIEVPPKALSLNGMLGIAFGAQGRGGTAAAHFVPGVNEINLTKTKGAGTLAHEWGHALDHYFAVQAGHAKGASPFMSAILKGGEGIRPEMVEAFKSVVAAMNKRHLTPVEIEERRKASHATAIKRLNEWLDSLRTPMKEKASETQLAEFDQLADRLRAGDLGEGYVKAGNKQFPQVVASLRNLAKDVMGRMPSLETIGAIDSWASSVRFYTAGKQAANEHVPQANTTYASESARADRDKGGREYWGTAWEMFARAFELYVADRLTEVAQQNTFLSDAQHRAAAKDIRGEGFAYPYPRGEERKVIGAAIDKLVQAIETRETDQGVAMYRRDERARGGSKAADVERWVAEPVASLAVPVKVVQNRKEMPFTVPADTAAYYRAGRIWLVADKIPNALAAQRRLLHEVVHAGLAQRHRGDVAGLDAALRDLVAKNSNVRHEGSDWYVKYHAKEIAKLVAAGADPADAARAVRRMSWEEGAAYHAEKAGSLTGWKAFVAQVQTWLRSKGFDQVANWLEGKTDAEFAVFLRDLRREVETPAAVVPEGAPAFAREPDDLVTVRDLGFALPNGNRYAVVTKGPTGEEHSYYATREDAEAAAERLREAQPPRPQDQAKPVRAEDRPQDPLGLARVERILERRRADSIKSADEALARQAAGTLKQEPERAGHCFPLAAWASIDGLGDMLIGETGDGEGNTIWHAVVMRDGAIYDPTFRQWFEPGVYEQLGFVVRKVMTPEQVRAYMDAHDGYTPDAQNQGLVDEPRYARADFKPGDGKAPLSPSGPIDSLLAHAGGRWVADHITKPVYDRVVDLGRFVPEKVKAGVVADYGLTEDYVDRRNEMRIAQREGTRKAAKSVDMLAGLDRGQSRVAYQWMTQREAAGDALLAQLPAEKQKTLRDLKDFITEMGKEAVDLGQLKPESFERNKMAYLHRSYGKFEMEDSAQEKTARARAIKVLGQQYKGRGILDEVAASAVQVKNPVKGQKFIRLEQRTKVTPDEVKAGAPDGSERLRRVVYVPAGREIEERFKAWRRDAATWEVREASGDKVAMWRDFTADERQRMGELDEVKFAVAKTLIMMTRDLEVGRFLRWVGEKYAKDSADGLKVVETPTGQALTTFGKDEWVQVPETKIPGTGVLAFGDLAGKYVPAAMWNDIRQVSTMKFNPLGETYASLLRMWKISKTALSPAVHMNNIASNVILADMADIGADDMARAARVFFDAKVRKDEKAEALLDRYGRSGGELGTFALSELQKQTLEPLLDELRAEMAKADQQGSLVAAANVMSLIFQKREFEAAYREVRDRLGKSRTALVGRKAMNAMVSLYNNEDQAFRFAAWLKAVNEGRTDLEAGKVARASFLDYHINAPWIQNLRATALPFIAFSYRAVPMLLKAAAEKPWKLAKYAAVYASLNTLGYLGSGGDEDRERQMLPEEKSGRMWGVFPRLMRMPWNDEHDSPVFLDIRRWIPAGDVVDFGQHEPAIPVPATLFPGGPLVLLAELLLNKSSFTGKPVTLETDTALERAGKALKYVHQALAPNIPLIPWTYSYENVMGAGSGKTDAFGRELSLTQALAGSVGVKLGSYPPDVLEKNIQSKLSRDTMELDMAFSKVKRQLERRGITEEEFDREEERYAQKKEKLRADAMKKLEGTKEE